MKAELNELKMEKNRIEQSLMQTSSETDSRLTELTRNEQHLKDEKRVRRIHVLCNINACSI